MSKKLLVELARRARHLEEAIGHAGRADQRRISQESVILDLRSFRASLDEFGSAAEAAASRIEPGSRGARGNPEFIQLLIWLARLWLRAHGPTAPRITKVGEHYEGKFIVFVQDVLTLPAFQLKKTNSALGKAIEKAWTFLSRSPAGNESPE